MEPEYPQQHPEVAPLSGLEEVPSFLHYELLLYTLNLCRYIEDPHALWDQDLMEDSLNRNAVRRREEVGMAKILADWRLHVWIAQQLELRQQPLRRAERHRFNKLFQAWKRSRVSLHGVSVRKRAARHRFHMVFQAWKQLAQALQEFTRVSLHGVSVSS